MKLAIPTRNSLVPFIRTSTDNQAQTEFACRSLFSSIWSNCFVNSVVFARYRSEIFVNINPNANTSVWTIAARWKSASGFFQITTNQIAIKQVNPAIVHKGKSFGSGARGTIVLIDRPSEFTLVAIRFFKSTASLLECKMNLNKTKEIKFLITLNIP